MAVKIFHYSGEVGEEENPRTRLPREPYVSRQTVTINADTATASAPAPAGCHLARIETPVIAHFRVILSGGSGEADEDDPYLHSWGQHGANWINLPPGAVVSLLQN